MTWDGATTAIATAAGVISTGLVGGVGWLFRLQRAVDGNHASAQIQSEQMNGRIGILETRVGDIKDDVTEIKHDVKIILERL